MDRVNFITLEQDKDIIISFSFDEGTEFGVAGFTIQRTPELEFFLDKDERGACVEWEDGDVQAILDEVHISREVISMKTRGKIRHYSFDIRNIADDEFSGMVENFRLVNFDDSINITQDI
jgi:hypothetical protein